ncbi:MAG: type II toxin-antitoxin system RelE/ParE family toxin [Candidatus Uhrbacteria bacterium]
MAYALEYLERAQDDLDQLDPLVARRTEAKMRWFATQRDPFRYASRLTKPAIGDVRFRIGDYRVIAYADQRRKRIVVAAVGNRRDIYR